MDLVFDKELLNRDTIDPSQYGNIGLFSHDIPGIGGEIKVTPEDFEVEEIPAYYPSGEGAHLFLWIEKRLLSSDELITLVSRALNLPARGIGYAGKKDRNAVTQQFISVPREVEAQLENLEGSGIKVLSCRPHQNKLVVGHSKGNRFRIKIRNITESSEERITQIAERISRWGLPNFFGPQRFGKKGDTAEIGFKILKGETSSLAKHWRNKSGKKFAVSAAQSYLYNRYLLRRFVEAGHRSLWLGDVVFKASGGIFKVEDLEEERPRFLENEIIPAGPIFGKKTFASSDEATDFEEKILAEAGIERTLFSSFGKLMMGTRRANICRPESFSYSIEANTLNLAFTLPAGSYATVLLAEFMKPLQP